MQPSEVDSNFSYSVILVKKDQKINMSIKSDFIY